MYLDTCTILNPNNHESFVFFQNSPYRASYFAHDQETLNAALNAVIEEGMAINASARYHGVPRSTLHRHVAESKKNSLTAAMDHFYSLPERQNSPKIPPAKPFKPLDMENVKDLLPSDSPKKVVVVQVPK